MKTHIQALAHELHDSTENLIDICSSEDYKERVRAHREEHGHNHKGYSFNMPQDAQDALERYVIAYEAVQYYKHRNTLTLEEIRSLGQKGILWDSVK